MPVINIPHGQGRDGWIDVYINGVQYHHKVGEDIEVTQAEIEVLMHAGIIYGVLPNGTAPLIFADFKNGVYTIDGASASVTDLIESNADYGVTFNPADIVAGVGYVSAGGGGSLKSNLATFISEGFTIVPTVSFLEGSGGVVQVEAIELPGFSTEVFGNVTVGGGPANIIVTDGSGAQVTDIDVIETGKVAFNLSRTRYAGSLNGRPVVADDVSFASPAFNTSIVFLQYDAVLESVGWYPLQDEADLPALSAL